MQCAICKKHLEFYDKEYNMLSDAAFAIISPGYGSAFDLTDIKFAICDSCIKKIVEDKSSVVSIRHLI